MNNLKLLVQSWHILLRNTRPDHDKLVSGHEVCGYVCVCVAGHLNQHHEGEGLACTDLSRLIKGARTSWRLRATKAALKPTGHALLPQLFCPKKEVR